MITQFKTLFTVAVVHTYYREKCEDIRFITTRDTVQLLKNGRLLVRELDGTLHVLFEADESGAALVPVSGKTLVFGLQLVNPCFGNFTDVGAGFASSTRVYRNSATPNALAAPESARLVGQVFNHAFSDSARPVMVMLKSATGAALQLDTISVTEDRSSVSYNLTGKGPGAYTVEEVFPGNTKQNVYYSDPELAQAGVFGVLEIKVDATFYTTAASFELLFSARAEILKYYIVANGYTDPEFDQLSVSDAGFTEEGRPQIDFTKVSSAAFTAGEISPALLGDSDARVVLFKSQTKVARTEKARKKIQLKKNGEVLMAHLPQPGPEKSNADLIIALAKP
jgi:hypothetical protein